MFFLVFLVGVCGSNGADLAQAGSLSSVAYENIPTRTVVINSAEEVFKLFEQLHYTRKEWAGGDRLVPRIYIAGIPARWQKKAHELTVVKKKALFFRLLGPLILHANETIKADRRRLLSLKKPFSSLSASDQKWLLQLAGQYKVINSEVTSLTAEDMAELKIRVDVVPASLALAQGAEESGWGTSRFAILGNSLFGQWDFSGKGITPEKQRKELGDYGLARFDTPLDSVIAYMRNLNTHNAYKALRQYRAKLRAEGKKVTGFELAKKLDKYSERGLKYVEGLHAIMRINKLAPTDDAHLSNKEIIYIEAGSRG